MDYFLENCDFDKCTFCVYTLVKLLNSIYTLYDSLDDIPDMREFKRYLCLNDKNLEEYHEMINNSFRLIDCNICDYSQTYLYLKNNPNIHENFHNKKKEYLISFTTIIKNIITYFQDNKQSQLFNMTQFIKTEISECFYEMYRQFKISEPKQAHICLEKSSNIGNYKAHFELGLINLEKCNYSLAYSYFFLCSDFPISEPLEICYPPSLFMVGIMYYHGLYVKKDVNIFKEIFEMSSKLNQCQPDDNFERAIFHLPNISIF